MSELKLRAPALLPRAQFFKLVGHVALRHPQSMKMGTRSGYDGELRDAPGPRSIRAGRAVREPPLRASHGQRLSDKVRYNAEGRP